MTRPIIFPSIDDSHFDRIHSSLTTVRCFDNGYVGKQPVAWEEYCAEYWLKEQQESKDRCTGHHDLTVENGIKHLTINPIPPCKPFPILNVELPNTHFKLELRSMNYILIIAYSKFFC